MGELVARRYPTQVIAGLADHTYVECGNGARGWSCWGGKIGGTALRLGVGSTVRADLIAGADERGGITCYLVNGVCHQAANRILLPAEITVRGAHGYEVSEALFGTYGRPSGVFGLCRAPFDQHQGSTGDLCECAVPTRRGVKARTVRRRPAAARERRYLRGVRAMYSRARILFSKEARRRSRRGRDLEDFNVGLFMHQVDFKLRARADRKLERRLRYIRQSTERARLKIEEWFAERELTAAEFAREFDNETRAFQHAVAGVMTRASYQRLFDLTPDTVVTLADPRIVRRSFKR